MQKVKQSLSHAGPMTEVEAKDLLRRVGFNVVETRLARSSKEAAAMGRELGFPVALKVVSLQVVHKSNVGGVRLNLAGAHETAQAYEEILAAVKARLPEAEVQGMAVQRMAPPGVEVVMGGFRDASFGPVLMFGLGGLWVEVLQDVAFRLVPLEARDARDMVREIRGYPLLEGYRGQPGVDIPFMEEMILLLSRFMEDNPEVREVDLNPVIAYPEQALVVDARVVMR
ncbi:MAG: acetate--CoA ligase family protein [Chloroflexi bacterium]|nr:acetate--CoA ligase family protein [Chloroflexota bacterium]